MKRQLEHYFDLLYEMTKRELHVRYKHTLFGFIWIIANPLLQMIVIGSIFKFFVKEPIKNYYYYLLVGLHLWNFFTLSVTKATTAIVFERSLIKKARFPHSVIPLSITLSNFVHFLIGLLLLLIPLFFFHITTVAMMPALALGLLLLLAFTVGFSFLMSALNVHFRDVYFLIQALLIVWFYATPIVYSMSSIPPQMKYVWWFNPLTAVVQLLQYSLAGAVGPDPLTFTINVLLIVLFVVVGIATFVKLSQNFDDWI